MIVAFLLACARCRPVSALRCTPLRLLNILLTAFHPQFLWVDISQVFCQVCSQQLNWTPFWCCCRQEQYKDGEFVPQSFHQNRGMIFVVIGDIVEHQIVKTTQKSVSNGCFHIRYKHLLIICNSTYAIPNWISSTTIPAKSSN